MRHVLGSVLLATTLLASGCGLFGEDRPTTDEAGADVTEWTDPLRDTLTHGVPELEEWQVTEDATEDQTEGCDEGEARRTYAAMAAVGSQDSEDADTQVTLVTGQLVTDGWDPSDSLSENDSGIVEAVRDAEDPTGTELSVELSRVPDGWHYEVTARTDCLPTD